MKRALTAFVSALALVFAPKSAIAQNESIIDFGRVDKVRLAVTGGQLSMRVGNAVLVRAFEMDPELNFATSERYLASCNGRWISESFDWKIHEIEQGWSPALWNRKALKDNAEIEPYAVGFDSWAQSESRLSTVLRPKLEEICRSAAAEPRNLLISISSSVPDKDDIVLVGSIVTGTAVRQNDLVDAWVRTSKFKLEPWMIGDKPLVVNGETRKKRVPTGAYDMTRSTYDCKNRRAGSYNRVDYEPNGRSESQSIDRDRLKLDDIVPNSVGESILDAVCMIYGPPK